MNTTEIAGLVLLVLISYGYFRFLNSVLRIRCELCPAITVCTWGCILFVSGILGILICGLYCILLTGVLLLVYSLYKSPPKQIHLSYSLIAFVIFSLYIFCRLINEHVYTEDNYNHWALIVKYLHLESKFPSQSDTIIVFYDYPTGSAVFIWFITRLIGFSEGKMLIAQSLLNLCLAFTIFSYIEKNINNRRDRILSSAIATYSLIVLSSCPFNLSNGIFDLTVDLLLCNIAIAAFSILIYYKDTPLKASILLCPVLSFLGCVKNSGLFLLLMIICLFIYFTNKQTKSLKLHIYTLISILIVPMLFRVLWEIHIKLSYPPTQAIDTINNTEYSTHPLSIQYYLHIISDKSKEDYSQTIINFFKYIFSFQNNVIFLGMIFIIILFYFSHNKISSPTTNVLTTFSVIVYFCYEIGVLLTFMFSLRKEESAWTVDYSRYSMTIEKFIFGVIIYIIITNISTLHLLSKNTNRFGIALPLFATLLILGFGATSVVSYFQHISMKNFVVIKDSLEKTIEVNNEIGTDSSKSYVVYYSEFNDHEYYRKHLSRYVLYSSEIKFISSEDIEEYSIKDFQQYDYLIVWQDDSSIEQFFTDNDISFNKVLDLKNVG